MSVFRSGGGGGGGYGSVPFTLPCRVLLLDVVQEPHGGAAGQDAVMEL